MKATDLEAVRFQDEVQNESTQVLHPSFIDTVTYKQELRWCDTAHDDSEQRRTSLTNDPLPISSSWSWRR